MKRKFKSSLKSQLIFLLLAILSFTFVLVVQRDYQKVTILTDHYPVLIYNRSKNEPQVEFKGKRPLQWFGIGQISKMAVMAIVVSEDWPFFEHSGYDTSQIKVAIKENWKAKRFARGASTITQQVARNVFLNHKKNLWRKFRELVLAISLERHFSKHKILEIYFNIVEWGKGIYGIGAATQFYFNKNPSELNAKEGAFLAMLLPNPKRYGVSFHQGVLTDYAHEVIDSILHKMVQAGFLSQDEAQELLAQPLSFEDVLEDNEEEFSPQVLPNAQ